MGQEHDGSDLLQVHALSTRKRGQEGVGGGSSALRRAERTVEQPEVWARDNSGMLPADPNCCVIGNELIDHELLQRMPPPFDDDHALLVDNLRTREVELARQAGEGHRGVELTDGRAGVDQTAFVHQDIVLNIVVGKDA